MNKYTRLTHGAGISEDNMDFDERLFYLFIINSKSTSENYYSSKTAENYVGAISELYVMLRIQYSIEIEYNSMKFLDYLVDIKNGNFKFGGKYIVGRKEANNFKSMNELWNGTYSAAIKLFNKYIEKNIENGSVSEMTVDYIEGNEKVISSTIYERNPISREKCLKLKGFDCSVCGLNFMEEYGDIGLNFIHVHHQRPLHLYKNQEFTNIVEDLFPLCPNCHAMIHRTDPILSVEKFKVLYQKLHK